MHRSTRWASAPRCSSTPTTSPQGVANAVEVAGPDSARSASTPATSACWPARSANNSTASAPPRPASWCRVISTSSRSPRCAPSPSTSTASEPRWSPDPGAPTASMVYKLVEVDGMPVEKRSSHKESHGGRKEATRLAKPSGTIVEEVVHPVRLPTVATEAGAAALTIDAGARRRTRRRPQHRRGPRARQGRAAQPALGRPETIPRANRRSRPA